MNGPLDRIKHELEEAELHIGYAIAIATEHENLGL